MDDLISKEHSHGRLIDADKLCDEVYKWCDINSDKYEFIELIKEAPTILMPHETVTGHWIVWDTSSYDWTYKCDKCGSIARKQSNYCPKCGAKMVELQESKEKNDKSPCDLCCYNPPSSSDGKPCTICPAVGKER